MEPKRSWWQKIKIHPVRTVLIAAILAVAIVLVILSTLGYIYNWDWTGLGPYVSPPHSTDSDFQRGKTLWDWLQLLSILAIPVVVGFGAVWFTTRQGKVADAENKDNQRETALQAYIDKMSDLLLHENLRESEPDTDVRDIARAKTLALLPQLDASRKGILLKFLYETNLIKGDNCVIDLSDADLIQVNIYPVLFLEQDRTLYRYSLSGINLNFAHLEEACLALADLSGSNLRGALLHHANLVRVDLTAANLQNTSLFYTQLEGANLKETVLIEADMVKVDLTGADLTGANLKGAKYITVEELEKQASSLKGATMPDGSIHP